MLANLKVHWICVDPEPEPLSLVTLEVQSVKDRYSWSQPVVNIIRGIMANTWLQS